MPSKNCCVCLSRTSIENGIIVEKVLQGRFCSFRALVTFYAPNAGGKLEKMGVGQFNSVSCTVNDNIVRTPRKNSYTSTNISLSVIFVGKINATCIFVAKW